MQSNNAATFNEFDSSGGDGGYGRMSLLSAKILLLVSVAKWTTYKKNATFRERAKNIGRRTRNAQLVYDRRFNRLVEEQSADNINLRNQVARIRSNANSGQRTQRIRGNTLKQRGARQQATNAHREHNQRRMQDNRALARASLNRLAFEYDP